MNLLKPLTKLFTDEIYGPYCELEIISVVVPEITSILIPKEELSSLQEQLYFSGDFVTEHHTDRNSNGSDNMQNFY